MDTQEGFYSESRDPEFLDLVLKGYKSVMHVEEDVLAVERPVNKVALYHKTNIEHLAKDMIPRWSKRLHCAISGEIWVDFLNKESNKGNAIRSIQNILGILPEETMVFGDNFNDIEMLRSAGELCREAGSQICSGYKCKRRSAEGFENLIIKTRDFIPVYWEGYYGTGIGGCCNE